MLKPSKTGVKAYSFVGISLIQNALNRIFYAFYRAFYLILIFYVLHLTRPTSLIIKVYLIISTYGIKDLQFLKFRL